MLKQISVAVCLVSIGASGAFAAGKYESTVSPRPEGRWNYTSNDNFGTVIRSKKDGPKNKTHIIGNWRVFCPKQLVEVKVDARPTAIQTVCFDEANHSPVWTHHVLVKSRLDGKSRPSVGTWFHWNDPAASAGTAFKFAGASWDRGHLSPNSDFSGDPETAAASFTVMNRVPQEAQFNQGPWRCAEQLTRQYFTSQFTLKPIQIYGKIHVITGIVPGAASSRVSEKNGKSVPIPAYMWKVVLDTVSPTHSAIVFWRENKVVANDVIQFASLEPNGGADYLIAGAPTAVVDQINRVLGPKVSKLSPAVEDEILRLMRKQVGNIPDIEKLTRAYCRSNPPACAADVILYDLVASVTRPGVVPRTRKPKLSSPGEARKMAYKKRLRGADDSLISVKRLKQDVYLKLVPQGAKTCSTVCAIKDVEVRDVATPGPREFLDYVEALEDFVLTGQDQPCPSESGTGRDFDQDDPRLYYSISTLHESELRQKRGSQNLESCPVFDPEFQQEKLMEIELKCVYPN